VGALANLAILPVVEMFSDKSIYMYRPCRDCYDLIFSLKTFFRLSDPRLWFYNYGVEKIIISPGWLLKAFPLDKKVLYFWISNYHRGFGSFSCSIYHNFYFSILCCLFNGIVFVIKLSRLFLF
jgi:hypothetical protein